MTSTPPSAIWGWNLSRDGRFMVVESIIAASQQLENQVDIVREGADHQRDRLHEVIASIGQMTSTVLDVAKNAARAAQSADDTKARASAGASVVAESVHSIDRVNAVSMNRLPDGKLCGDVDYDGVKDIVSAITPVPGGVGPMTIATLMANTVEAFRWQRQPPACPVE